MPQVPIQKVSWPSREAFVLDVVQNLMKLGLSKESSEILTAHIALSCGWGAHCDNYRFAGIKATSESQDYVILTGFEYINGKKVYNKMKWRSYPTVEAGLKAILNLLSVSRYKKTLAYLKAGDTEYFSQLGRDGWYTAPIAETAAGMKSRLTQIRKFTSGKVFAQAAGITGAILAALAGAAYWYMK